jgi:hypothetical protein
MSGSGHPRCFGYVPRTAAPRLKAEVVGLVTERSDGPTSDRSDVVGSRELLLLRVREKLSQARDDYVFIRTIRR